MDEVKYNLYEVEFKFGDSKEMISGTFLANDDDPENEIKKLMLTKLGEQIEIVSIVLLNN
jgi:Mor family transcriptional regulator